MTIRINREVEQTILVEGRREYPHECCGLLLGTMDGDVKQAVAVWLVPNEWTAEIELTEAEDGHSLRDRFYLPPKAYLQADRAARSRDLDIVGCCHSHPDARAQPSERDRAGASGVGGGTSFSFLVLSVMDGIPGELTSWLLSPDGTAWQAETLEFEES